MKHLKTLETINDGPKIGDYIIVKSNSPIYEINDFIENNIGQIFNIVKFKNSRYGNTYYTKYNNIPSEIKVYFQYLMLENKLCYYRGYDSSSIIEYSKNKENLEIILQAKKYNL